MINLLVASSNHHRVRCLRLYCTAVIEPQLTCGSIILYHITKHDHAQLPWREYFYYEQKNYRQNLFLQFMCRFQMVVLDTFFLLHVTNYQNLMKWEFEAITRDQSTIYCSQSLVDKWAKCVKRLKGKKSLLLQGIYTNLSLMTHYFIYFLFPLQTNLRQSGTSSNCYSKRHICSQHDYFQRNYSLCAFNL